MIDIWGKYKTEVSEGLIYAGLILRVYTYIKEYINWCYTRNEWGGE